MRHLSPPSASRSGRKWVVDEIDFLVPPYPWPLGFDILLNYALPGSTLLGDIDFVGVDESSWLVQTISRRVPAWYEMFAASLHYVG